MKFKIWILTGIIILTVFLIFFKLGKIPISLHGDEVGVGYNAYTLLKYGVDEYNKKFPISFRADVTPIIFYVTIPAIALFGLNEFSIRLPSALVGIFTTIIFYIFIKELIKTFLLKNKSSVLNQNFSFSMLALLSTLFISISPWHIQLSRIVHDAAYGLFLQLCGLTLFFKFIRNKSKLLFILSISILSLSVYAYHSPRLTTPLLIILLFWIFRKFISLKQIICALIIVILISVPLITDIISKPFSQSRFAGINLFIGLNPSNFSLIDIIIKFILNYVQQFNPFVLFYDTSNTRYFNVCGTGLFYLTSIPFIIIGLYRISFIPKFRKFIYGWIIISVLPGALTSGPPNAGRIAMLFPTIDFLTAFGITHLISITLNNSKLSLKVVIPLIYTISFINFLNAYFNDSITRFKQQWQYGAKQIAQYTLAQESKYDQIIITDSIKQIYIYILLYGEKNPTVIFSSQNTKRNSYIGYASFGKYEFRKINLNEDLIKSNTLIIGLPEEFPYNRGNLIKDERDIIIAKSISN
ncbi:MAG: hypothetical protein UR52_C0001G0055 [Candidatus Gottesmanbacteria bacterium GW2011_GWA1_34_13]|uniref:Glycosyltransferase RgtA/B/C/D-like domain-containing protein n=1 Tax=Candidatus Gottesmanbacteria bacterium GW2011_GWA1_34_13 TaxID=1618434 RepID=A0A0G0D9G5_9BACT|nr:MAG: hypothetical protein UR52_C0001G0055 [Candidatus Gottesmanbacteria bacterium GW2011_GWA1_34_13]